MMNNQEKLWNGVFGDAYHQRNKEADRLDFWTTALHRVSPFVQSAMEIGAGQGDNLAALRMMIPGVKLTGVEINNMAAERMRQRKFNVIEGPFNTTSVPHRADLILTRGFLIHVPEDELEMTLDRIFYLANKYVCFAEYYAPTRREVCYRGYTDALWCDDFAKRIMERHRSLRLRDYGFSYHATGGDDLTWFLMEKKGR